jgi:hypothetical protein
LTAETGNGAFDLVSFTVSGQTAEPTTVTELTPNASNDDSFADSAASRDGQTLWYQLILPSGTETLYEVSATVPTIDPASYSPSINSAGETFALGDLPPDWIGWYWKGELIYMG